MKSEGKKVWIKRIGFICLVPLLLVLLIIVLLYIPPIQNLIVKKASQYASESLDMQIDIGRINLSFPLNLNIKDISVIDNDRDTLLYSNDLVLSIRLLPLLNKNISVRTLQLSGISFNTKTLIEGIELTGYIGDLNAKADQIYLTQEKAVLNNLILADSHVSLRIDTISSADTTTSTSKWKIQTEEIKLENISFDLEMPIDSIRLNSHFEEVLLTDGEVDLGTSQYSAFRFKALNSRANYDLGEQSVKMGIDPLHLVLSDISIEIDSFLYQGKNINAHIQEFSLKEHSGLFITSLNGKIVSDEQTLVIPGLSLETPYSKIDVLATVPWSSLGKDPQGNLTTQLTVSLDRRDVLIILGELSDPFERFYPDGTLKLSGLAEGNLDKIYLRRLESELSGAVKIEAHGIAEKITDEVARAGEFYLKAQTNDESSLREILLKESGGKYSIPGSLFLDLQASLLKGEYQANMLLSEQSGNILLSGRYHPVREEYGIDLKVDSLALVHFLPKDSILNITANLKAEGKGTDLFAGTTWAQLNGSLGSLIYKENTISGISLDGSLKNHQLQAKMISDFPYLQANMTIDGDITKEKVSGMLILDVDSLDLYGLQFTKRPFTNSFQIFSEIETDLNKNHLIDVTLGNWEMAFGNQRFNPKTLTLHAKGNEDTTYVSFHAGDLGLYLTGNADIQELANKLNEVKNDAMKQLQEDSTVNFDQLRPLFPEIDLQIAAKRDNPIYNYLQTNNIFFDHFEFNAATSPEKGINADGLLYSFIKDTLKIDSVQLNLRQDSAKLNYTIDVVKNKFRNQEPFKAGVKGSLEYAQGDIEAYYLNGKGQTGLHLGAQLKKQANGINIRFFPEDPVIAFLPFTVNSDNYILIKNPKDISANLRMDGDEYATLWIHSLEKDSVMQELLVEINQINLDKLSTGFSRIPPLEGLANVSLRYVPMDNSFMLVGEAGVDNLLYHKERVGEFLMSGVYLPLDRNQHQVDMHIFHDQHEIANLSALYQSIEGGQIDGTTEINKMPLSILNPFFTGTARLNGALQGTMTMAGTTKEPILNGYLKTDTANIYVTTAGTNLRLDENPINITDSRVYFDKYKIYSAGNNPFVIDGTLDIRKLSKGTADLKLTAKNMQLLDAKKDRESLVYGRLFVDLNSTVKGPLNALSMRGNLHLLGGTNLSYILRESPLTIQDRMSGLVTFTYFQDTIPRRNRLSFMQRREREASTSVNNSGMDLLMAIQIDPAVKFKVDLDEYASDRIELQGGGDLSFKYTSQGDMVLSGRYTLSDGLLKYNMPVISDKTLDIKEDSYIEWSGDPMDPYLNIKATERVRTYVSTDGQSSRLVNFDAGIEVKQRMENLSLQFTLDALDDVTMQNQLIAMGAEERSKQAVGLLLTGIYLGADQAGRMNLNMGSALNAFIENEINHLAGDLLGGVDFTFGLESYDGMEGQQRTDYSFRFSKRFYNDRLNIILGGIVSTGSAAQNNNNNFINDAALEYRLDTGGNRYGKLFYNRKYESLLEGEIARYGVGFVFRRKMRRLNELFMFRDKKSKNAEDVVEENK